MRIGVALVVLSLIVVASCSAGAGAKTTATSVDATRYTDMTAARTIAVQAQDDLFTPEAVKIRAGTTVVFENGGRNVHNVKSGDGSFHDIASDAFAPGAKVRVVFHEKGAHDYWCSLHGSPSAGMRGSILVVP